MTFNFTGTGIKIDGLKGSDKGIAIVIIDKEFSEVDFYSETTKDAIVFEKTGLTQGTHTISIQTFGMQSNKSTGSSIAINGFNIIDGTIQ